MLYKVLYEVLYKVLYKVLYQVLYTLVHPVCLNLKHTCYKSPLNWIKLTRRLYSPTRVYSSSLRILGQVGIHT